MEQLTEHDKDPMRLEMSEAKLIELANRERQRFTARAAATFPSRTRPRRRAIV